MFIRQAATHRSTLRIREVQVVTADDLLFAHARQVVCIRRRRRQSGTKKWTTETVYAITDLPVHQARPDEVAAWAREAGRSRTACTYPRRGLR
jgi:hypothetical protein